MEISSFAKLPVAKAVSELPAVPLARADNLAQLMHIEVHKGISEIVDFWKTLEAEKTATIYQRHEWAQIALTTLEREKGAEPFIVTGTIAGRPAMLLPLVKVGSLYPRVRWIGGSHMNFNMGLYSREFLALASRASMLEIIRKIALHAPQAITFRLCCQPQEWNGATNPMASLAHQQSTNPTFFMNLNGGFEALLARGNAKRKRKKFRQQCKEAQAAGGHRLVIAKDAFTVTRLLDVFIEQKTRRLAENGIHNVFTERGAREMLSSLALSSLNTQQPLLRLHGLEIGGKIRAVFGGGIHATHFSGYFSSIADDEMTQMSPGEMLLYLLTEHCCSEGIESMDLGSGDERYKRSWCEQRQELFDVILPVRAIGIPFAYAERAAYHLRRKIRENSRLWGWFNAVRRSSATLLRR